MSGGTIYQMNEAGLNQVTMKYEDGGRTEVWSRNAISVRVPAGTPTEEVKRLLAEKFTNDRS